MLTFISRFEVIVVRFQIMKRDMLSFIVRFKLRHVGLIDYILLLGF